MNEPTWGTPSENVGPSGTTGRGAPGERPRSGAGWPATPAGSTASTAFSAPAPSSPSAAASSATSSQPADAQAQSHQDPSHSGPSHAAQQHTAQSHNSSSQSGSQPSDEGEQRSGEQQSSASQGKKRAGRDLGAAIGVGVTLGAVVIASLFLYKPVFLGVIVLAVVIGVWELTSRLRERKGIRVPLIPLALGGAAMVIVGYIDGAEGAWVTMGLTALALLVWRMTDSPTEYLRDITAGVFAAFYVPFLATFVALMLVPDDGPWRVLVFLLLTVVADTGAYAVGWWFGKHKLAPRISPGKTREGLFGALAAAMAVGAVCVHFLIDDGTWWQGLVIGFAVAATATLGDLGESMIKRDLGIKDMGSLLPGHGGIMDRLDSLLPTAPIVWLLFAVFVGAG